MTDSKIHCADHDYFDGLCGACYRELRKFAKQADQRIAEQQRVIDQLKQAVIDLSKHIDPLGIADPCEETLETVRKLLGENNG